MAAVWRRQTFTAAVEKVAPETTRSIFEEHLPSLAALLNDQTDDPLGTRTVLEDAYKFSRMLHLAKRCRRSERGDLDRVGATIFPGLVKVSRNLPGPGVPSGDTAQTVVRRAQVICECALQATSYPGSTVPPTPTTM